MFHRTTMLAAWLAGLILIANPPADAAIVATHFGRNDPAMEGWGPSPSGGIAVIEDGEAAWRMQGSGSYVLNPGFGLLNGGTGPADGWAARFRVKMENRGEHIGQPDAITTFLNDGASFDMGPGWAARAHTSAPGDFTFYRWDELEAAGIANRNTFNTFQAVFDPTKNPDAGGTVTYTINDRFLNSSTRAASAGGGAPIGGGMGGNLGFGWSGGGTGQNQGHFWSQFILADSVADLPGAATWPSWDLEFNGSGDPGRVFTESRGINSGTYGTDSRFTPGAGTVPGWMTVHGNPGGILQKDFTGITRAEGWTLEWAFKAHPATALASTDVVRFGDDSNLIKVRYQDQQVQLMDASGKGVALTDLDIRQPHTYRLVRQPGADTVDLHIDNSAAPFISLRPDPCGPPDCGAGHLNRIEAAPSEFESSFDFIRYKSGASLAPAPPPPTKPGVYIPTEVQFGANRQPYLVNPAINNHAVLPDHPLPKLWQSGNTIRMMAARGEYEPATFVVETDTPLQAVDVQVGPLTGAEGTLPAKTLDVRVAQPYFRRVTDWPAEMPWVLVHDPDLFTIVDQPPPWATDLPSDAPKSHFGYTKTNLLTRAAIDTETLQPSDITDRQQFWITAKIPANARPGTYTAPVTVVPANAPPMQLTLEVRVPDLELREPEFEYSAYYPAFLDGGREPWIGPSSIYAQLSDTQYVNEMRNMMAHGMTNPVFYTGVEKKPNGRLDFTLLEEYISLREQAGMDLQGKPLYLPDNPLRIVQRNLTPAEYARNVDYTSQIVAWAEQKGYGDVHFMANDEASASGLLAERDSFQSVHDGGGKVWVSVQNSDYFESAGDLLDVPVLHHPGHLLWDRGAQELKAEEFLLNPEDMKSYYDPERFMTPAMQAMIDAVHENGYKIFTYMDPTGGGALPEAHRLFRGLGLWKVGLDGSMTWAYTHIASNDVSFADFDPTQDTLPPLIGSFVFRGEQAPFDTLGWEGFREGVDDARYLATLLYAMDEAAERGEHTALVSQTQQWLDGLYFTAGLDAMRLEMAWRIEILNPIGGSSVLPEPNSGVLLVLGCAALWGRGRTMNHRRRRRR